MPIISMSAGGEKEYLERYHESTVLGQGEFGLVKLIHDVKSDEYLANRPLAVKYLRKGFQFRDNTIYSPVKREVLRGEVEMLRRLNGECYTLRLIDVYESNSAIYIITEYCEGGEMLSWASNAFADARGGGLRTEDVSRISHQLWSAVDHCARHRVIHRDIKPGE
jgi:serine/threonine protein kinase